MRVLSINHERDAGPGVFVDALRAAGAAHDQWFLAEGGRPPADPAGYDAVMVFGGSMNADEEDKYPWMVAEKALLGELLDGGVPMLGVCLGAQFLAEAAGGSATAAREPEIGWPVVELTDAGLSDPLTAGLPNPFEAFSWHGYECVLPDGATVLASSAACTHAYRLGDAPVWGIQFHAEVTAADAANWTDHAAVEPAAIRAGLDPALLHAQTAPRIEAWNRLGRALCGRFLTAAESARLGAGRPT